MKPESVEIPVRIVVAEMDDGAAQQRQMAEHIRTTGRAWLELAQAIDAFADYLDTLPRQSGGSDDLGDE